MNSHDFKSDSNINCNINKEEHQKIYQYVFDYFSGKILSGELKINDRIPPEREIAEQLNVSRNSIREVMHMLEMNGFLECRQGSGNYVRCEPLAYMTTFLNMVMALKDIDYAEVYHIRMGYETVALKLAMDQASEEEIESMREILQQMDQIADPRESAKLDVAFHRCLVDASHNRLLVLYSSMLGDLMDQFIEDFHVKIMDEQRSAELLRRSHWNIYDAVVDKDFSAGSAAMRKHFDIVGEQLDIIMKEKNQNAHSSGYLQESEDDGQAVL
ncbi:MAG: FadR family transcriptional regulator [Clostridiales bacterium]|nr:FadR family transcriptional regulator [Clostridiales bacterium]